MTDKALIERTRALYKARPRTMTAASVAEGAKVPPAWLEDFAYGRTGNPRAQRVQQLHDYLSGHAPGQGA